MSIQINLPLGFNPERAEQLKEQGMSVSASSKANVLRVARKIAVMLAQQNPAHEVNIDVVIARLILAGHKPEELGNAAGSVFRKDFEFTGRWMKSTRVSNHARAVRVWKLKRFRDEEYSIGQLLYGPSTNGRGPHEA